MTGPARVVGGNLAAAGIEGFLKERKAIAGKTDEDKGDAYALLEEMFQDPMGDEYSLFPKRSGDRDIWNVETIMERIGGLEIWGYILDGKQAKVKVGIKLKKYVDMHLKPPSAGLELRQNSTLQNSPDLVLKSKNTRPKTFWVEEVSI